MRAGVQETPVPKIRWNGVEIWSDSSFNFLCLECSLWPTLLGLFYAHLRTLFSFILSQKHRTQSNNSFSCHWFRHVRLLCVDNAVYYFKYRNISRTYALFVIFLASLRVAGATYNAVFARDLFYRQLWISYECVVVAKWLDTCLSVPARSKPAVILEIKN
jgi:hypothetical protein